MEDLSPIIEPALIQKPPAQPAESHWRHSVRKYGLRGSIERLRKVGQDTEENLGCLCRAYIEEQAEHK